MSVKEHPVINDATVLDALYVMRMSEQSMVSVSDDGVTLTEVSVNAPSVTEKRGTLRVESTVNVIETTEVSVEILNSAVGLEEVTSDTGLVTSPSAEDCVRVY